MPRAIASMAIPGLVLLAMAAAAGAQEPPGSPNPAAAKPIHHARAKAPASPHDDSQKPDSSGNDSSSPFALTAGKGPINIQSDQLSLDYKGKAVLFNGHVHAIQSGSQMTCDTLHVNYEQNFKDIKDMTAEGNVRISQGGRWSTSDHALLNEKVNTVVLTGNPVVHDGPDEITGDRITVYLNTGKSVVEHAHAVIYRRESQTADNGASGAGADDQAATATDPASPGAAGTNPAAADEH